MKQRRAVSRVTAREYQRASKKEKGRILTTFIKQTKLPTRRATLLRPAAYRAPDGTRLEQPWSRWKDAMEKCTVTEV